MNYDMKQLRSSYGGICTSIQSMYHAEYVRGTGLPQESSICAGSKTTVPMFIYNYARKALTCSTIQ